MSSTSAEAAGARVAGRISAPAVRAVSPARGEARLEDFGGCNTSQGKASVHVSPEPVTARCLISSAGPVPRESRCESATLDSAAAIAHSGANSRRCTDNAPTSAGWARTRQARVPRRASAAAPTSPDRPLHSGTEHRGIADAAVAEAALDGSTESRLLAQKSADAQGFAASVFIAQGRDDELATTADRFSNDHPSAQQDQK